VSASAAPAPPADPDFPTFQAACRELAVELTLPLYDSLTRYAALLRDWNTRINLISRRDTGRILSYHILDSLAVLSLLPQNAKLCGRGLPSSTVVDVGTGAGLPGIPVALARPDVRVSLVESSLKKSLFLSLVLGRLPMTNVELLNDRAELLPPLEADIVLCRLTDSLPKLLKNVAHLRRPGGAIVLFKTQDCTEELPRAGGVLARFHLRVVRTHDVLLPLCRIPRRFVVLGD